MQSDESLSGETAAGAIDPWSIEGMRRLFLAPTSFFQRARLHAQANWLPAAWLLGLATAIDRVDMQMMRAELEPGNPARHAAIEFLSQSWVQYWGIVILAGTVSAALAWLIGGWWYRVRLAWSGARDPDPRLARLVFVFASLVLALPAFVFAVAETVVYPDPRAAWNSESVAAVVLLVFPFWSVAASYRGAMATFELRRGRALFWFVTLPCVAYVVLIGGIAALYSIFAPAA